MAGNLKKIFIIGNLGSDPTMRYTQDGTPVTSFNVAVSERRRGPGQAPDAPREEVTTWFRVSAWRNQAEIANNLLRKGTSVFVSGDLRTSEFIGQDGKPRFMLEITMQDMQILTPKGMSEAGGEAAFGGGAISGGAQQSSSFGSRQPAPAVDSEFNDEGDIPF